MEFDVCIIGTGAAGGILAYYLSQRGKRVVALEKGGPDPGEAYQNTKLTYQLPNLGLHPDSPIPLGDAPEALARVDLYANARDNSVENQNRFKNYQIFSVGGKTTLWNGVCLRFAAKDFKPEAQSDGYGAWPISYADLALHYSAIENLIGVCGTQEGLSECPDGEFLPPAPLRQADELLKEGLAKLGEPKVRAIPARKAVETRPDRSNSCQNCGTCVKGCANGSRYSFASRLLPALEKNPNFALKTHMAVSRLMTESGKVTAVEAIDTNTRETKQIRAKVFILSAGAIDSPRILLNSGGAANSSGAVGRYLMDNLKVDLTAALKSLVGKRLNEARGFGDHLLIPRFIFDSNSYRGGFCAQFMNFRLDTPLYQKDLMAIPRALRPLAAKLLVNSFVALGLSGSKEPRAEDRLELGAEVDPLGQRKVKVSYGFSDRDKSMIADMEKYGRRILQAAGGVAIGAKPDLSGGRAIHYAGTCRMSDEARDGVVDRNLKTHDLSNLYVCDGSVFPTLPEKNMTLTIMALAKRLADHLNVAL